MSVEEEVHRTLKPTPEKVAMMWHRSGRKRAGRSIGRSKGFRAEASRSSRAAGLWSAPSRASLRTGG